MLYTNEITKIPLFAPTLDFDENKYYSSGYCVCGNVVDVPRCGKLLIADYYTEDGNFYSRFVSDGQNYKTTFNWPAKRWTRQYPVSRHSYTRSDERFDNKVSAFFGGNSWRKSAGGIVSDYIFEKYYERRELVKHAELELRRKHFAMYPAYPDDINEYCGKRVFEHTYIFISKIQKDRKRTAKCAHCGKTFKVDASVKQGSDGVCPNCGAKAVYKADWQNMPFDESKICICSKVDNQLLIRWTGVYRTFHGFKEKYEYFDYAYNLFLNDGADVFFYKFFKGPYAYDYDWHRGQKGDICYDSTKVYSGNLREVFGSDYYGVDLQKEFEARNPAVKMAKLLFNLKNEPVSKYLLKLGMMPLAADADLIGYNRYAEKPSFTSVMGVSRQLIPLYRDFNVTAHEHRLIRAYGGWISPEDLATYRSFNLDNDIDIVSNLLNRMSFSKFVNYISKQKSISKKTSYSRLAVELRDYLNMSEALKVDMSHKSVRFPSDLVTAHAAITVRYNAVKHEAEDNLFAEKVKSLYANLPETYSKNGFCMVLPQLRSDLITEGQSLNHCVGMERYFKNHIAGTKMIFFIRKQSEPTKPFFTMELDMTEYRIKQLYGFGDCSAPKEVRSFAESYVQKIAPRARKTA